MSTWLVVMAIPSYTKILMTHCPKDAVSDDKTLRKSLHKMNFLLLTIYQCWEVS